MSIDSVGDSLPVLNDNARQQRKLQEQRDQQLKASEERQQREIEKLGESRRQQLENIYETQSHEIDARRREADDRVEIAKADAGARVREFELDSQKVTSEAKRQFQAKAAQLANASTTLENQRNMMVAQHDRALAQLRDNATHSEEVALKQAQAEATSAHLNEARNITEINDRGEIAAASARDKIEAEKRQAVSDGARQVRALQEDYADYSNQVKKQIDFTKLAGQDQMAKERENLRINQTRLELEAATRGERLERQTAQALDRMHFEGSRKLAETQTGYARQISESEKNAHEKIREQANRSSFTMQAMASESDAQEGIARATYANQKAAVSAARDKSVAENIKLNENLQKRLRADYETKSKMYGQETDRKLAVQFATDEAELKFHRDEGRKAVNAQVASTAETISGHAKVAASDAFYHVNIMAPQVTDGELETLVRIAVPEHEQDSVRISHQMNSLTVSGTRRFQDKVKLEGGREATTNSYQSYSENFPVRGKLDMNNMMRTYGDGILTFRIPKS